MEKVEEKKFCCPEIAFPDEPDNFCIPKDCCPDRLPQLKFPSPNTCLPADVLEDLKLRIQRANEFLLRTALSGDEERNNSIRSAFEGLLGQRVKVCIGEGETEVEQETMDSISETEDQAQKGNDAIIEGSVMLAGRDFTLLQEKKTKIILSNERVTKIKLTNRFAEPIHEASLRAIDPCFRRCLTFQFGKVVSESPELIHLFFNIPLRVFLLQFIDCPINFISGGKSIKGILTHIDRDNFLSICDDHKEKIVSLGDARMIKIRDN